MDVKRYYPVINTDVETGKKSFAMEAGPAIPFGNAVAYILEADHLAAIEQERDRARGMAGVLEAVANAADGFVYWNQPLKTLEGALEKLAAYKSTQPAAMPADWETKLPGYHDGCNYLANEAGYCNKCGRFLHPTQAPAAEEKL